MSGSSGVMTCNPNAIAKRSTNAGVVPRRMVCSETGSRISARLEKPISRAVSSPIGMTTVKSSRGAIVGGRRRGTRVMTHAIKHTTRLFIVFSRKGKPKRSPDEGGNQHAYPMALT